LQRQAPKGLNLTTSATDASIVRVSQESNQEQFVKTMKHDFIAILKLRRVVAAQQWVHNEHQ
jgi:hypothetical protein